MLKVEWVSVLHMFWLMEEWVYYGNRHRKGGGDVLAHDNSTHSSNIVFCS